MLTPLPYLPLSTFPSCAAFPQSFAPRPQADNPHQVNPISCKTVNWAHTKKKDENDRMNINHVIWEIISGMNDTLKKRKLQYIKVEREYL